MGPVNDPPVPSQTLLDVLPMGVCILSDDYVIVSWNRTLEDWTCIDRNSAVGTSLLSLFPCLAEERYASRIKQVFTDGTSAIFSPALHGHFLPVKVCTGGTEGFMVQSTQVRRIMEQPALALVTITDVTAEWMQLMRLNAKNEELLMAKAREQRATAAAESANLAKSDFLANMSHEIRTPMTAILGFAENLLDVSLSSSERLNYANTIRRNGEALLGIINDILDLSKIEAGKMDTDRIPCEPCSIIAEVFSLVQVQAEAKRLSFGIEYTGTIPKTIHTDPTRLRQVLINLLGNAIKFTEVGSVRLEIRLVDDRDEPVLQFDIIDTGRGLTQGQAEKLFQPFVQADTSTAREFGGTGLGLTISKRFTELLGGEVYVAKTERGVGSTFRATVATGPLDGVVMLDNPMAATVVAEATAIAAQSSSIDLHGLRILLAEDGVDNQRLISFVLTKAGAEVEVAENGAIAMAAALSARDEGTPFDCILMDMQMPVMDGYEAVAQLREKGCVDPIIALTAHAMSGDRAKCMKAGCDDYATKPIERKKLIKLIRKFVPNAASGAGLPQEPNRPTLQNIQ